jgi:predicted nucleic acid-binding protein
MIAADASAAIAAFAPWHEQHAAVQKALGSRPAIVAHAAFEAYSVLTRLPEPQRAPADIVGEHLERRFGERWLALPAGASRAALQRLARLGLHGGATYDALIAITAGASDATLVTLDRRALPTYQRVGVRVDLVD